MPQRERSAEALTTLGLFAFSFFAFALLLPLGASVILDDGYYYLQIAKNLASGRGSTFDGVNLTNGYHPLWMLALVAVFSLVPHSETALTAALLLQAGLAAAAVALLYRAARWTLSRTAAAAVALLWSLIWYRLALSGLEVSLSAVLVLATLGSYLKWFPAGDEPPPVRYFQLGLLASLAFLARLDNGFLVATLGGTLVCRGLERGARKRKRMLAFIAPAIILCGGYLGFNVWWFGSFLPISGAVKRAWSERLLELELGGAAAGLWELWKAKAANLLWPLVRLRYLNTFFILLGSAGALVLSLATYAGAGASSGNSRPWWLAACAKWRVFLAAACLQYVTYAVFFHGSVTYGLPWYYLTPSIAGMLIVGLMIDAGLRGFAVTRRFQAVLSLLGLGTLAGLLLWRAVAEVRALAGRDRAQEAGIGWIRQHLPLEAVVGSWNAGALGYLSGRRVINLDGLVNSRDFHLHDREHLCAYWDRIGLDYVADVMDPERGPAAALPLGYTFAECAARLVPLAAFNATHADWSFRVFRYRRQPPPPAPGRD